MTLIHIYDAETGKLKRSQEPVVDPVASAAAGETVYAEYPNSTTEPLPEYGEHEAPFFINGAWVVKGQYKNLEVYNTDTKSFEHCYTDELAANQHFIDDEAGIKRFKENYMKYIVNENFEIVDNPIYPDYVELQELEQQFAQTDSVYQTTLTTPVEFPVNHHLYKAIWVDDGTYSKIMTGALAGIITFPIDIWDATKLEENMVSMSQVEFGQLVAFLAQIQATAFDARKHAQSELLPLIEAKRAIVYPDEPTPPLAEESEE